MEPIRRAIVVVLDGVGVGEMPDAASYGDAGSNTLGNLSRAVGGLRLPNMGRLGLGNVITIDGTPAASAPEAAYGKMREASPGKDSVTGHWEMAGVVLAEPLPTYPGGFPREVIETFEAAIGRRTLGNTPASGTQIIALLGDEHVRTGRPIVYTSADSGFQVAMHEGIIPIEDQYRICATARRLLTGRHAVGRVICRPFIGEDGAYRRTERRRDFPLSPPPMVLDELVRSGRNVHAIGRIHEIFDGRGIRTWDETTNNPDHIQALERAVRANDSAMIFANLEDFDTLYGHRNDSHGEAEALRAWDAALPMLLGALRPGDLFLITADHGNDPTTPSTDHSREYAFLLACGPGVKPGTDLGTRETFADIAATVREAFELPCGEHGTSFLDSLRRPAER